jgi:beta-phosphoglucomutase-like phosphatase (HAD superfamily)
MVVATLRAGAESTGLPVQNCMLISGSQTGVLAAERVAMPCVVIRNRYIFYWNSLSYLYLAGSKLKYFSVIFHLPV